ncbi:MAG: YaiI/YqxD family protein [Planctomycetales bacterium]|nr:YaiI/YqxD family protein [Planctomycetales bacterium]
MQIWVDADACPYEIKEMLYRAAERVQVHVTLVANQVLRTPPSPWVNSLLVPGGMNIADRQIVKLVSPGDLVITADIPLAAEVVDKGAEALDPRGELYTSANVGERHAMRNMIDEMRGAGQVMRGPSGFTARNRQEFANQLDRWLTRVSKESKLKIPGDYLQVGGKEPKGDSTV